MGVTLERDDGDGPKRRELTDEDLTLLAGLLTDDIAADPPPADEGDRRRMLRHWLRPDGD